MVDLVKKFSKIEHFIYVSTAFVNCHAEISEDEIMDFPEDIDVIIDKLVCVYFDRRRSLIDHSNC